MIDMIKRLLFVLLVVPTVFITFALLPVYGIWWIIKGGDFPKPYPFEWLIILITE